MDAEAQAVIDLVNRRRQLALERLPASLNEGLDALRADATLVQGFGAPFIDYYERAKRSEALRFSQAEDTREFELREYFSRI